MVPHAGLYGRKEMEVCVSGYGSSLLMATSSLGKERG